jgi:hypothetical protein
MCTKFYWNNLSLEAVLSPSSENAQFPVENIQDARRTKVFRSTSNADHIYFDFGAAESIDSVVAVGHTINGLGFSTATIELNNVATWTMGALASIPLTIDTLNDIAFGSLVSPVNARYAKLILTSTLGYCEVAKLFIGKMDEVGTNDFGFPVNFQLDNKAIIQRNRYGQKFVDEITTQKLFSGSIQAMTNDECEKIYELASECSTTRPFFMRIEGAQIFNDGNRVAGYYYLKDDPVFSYTTGGFWSVGLSLEEGT